MSTTTISVTTAKSWRPGEPTMRLAAGAGQNLLGLGFPLSGSINGKTFVATELSGDTLAVSAQGGSVAVFPSGATVQFVVAGITGGGGSGTVTSIVAGSGLTGGTITTTGTLGLAATGATISQALLNPSTPAYASTINFDLSTTSLFQPGALTGNVSLTLTNAPASIPWVRPFTVILTQDATGSRLVSSWFSGFTIQWTGGSAPTLSTGANAVDTFVFQQIGATTLLGFIAGQTGAGSGGTGTVTSITAGVGLTGGVISTAGTIALANPSATTLGGIQSIATVAHNFLTGISTSGVPSQSQPAFTDISGTITTAQVGASQITYAKVQNVAAVSLLGNPTGSGAAPSEITLGANLSFSGTTLVASGGGGSGIPSRQFEMVTNVTVAATSGGSSLLSATSALGSLTIASGALNTAGFSLEIEFAGYASTASASAGILAFSLFLGGNCVATTISSTQSTSKTNVGVAGKIRVVVKTTGSSGTIDCGGFFSSSLANATGMLTEPIFEFTNGTTAGTQAPATPPTVNLTGTLAVDFQALYGSAVAGNSITLTQFKVTLIP